MTDNRKKPGAAFWATAALVLVYSLSVGPACRMLSVVGNPEWAVTTYHAVYAPIFWVHENGPKPISDAIFWYCRAGT